MICTVIWVMPFLVGFPQWKNQNQLPIPFGIMPGRAAAKTMLVHRRFKGFKGSIVGAGLYLA
jgi:hypothetical protein